MFNQLYKVVGELAGRLKNTGIGIRNLKEI